MNANMSEIYNQEKKELELDFYYIVQIPYMSKESAYLTRLHLTELGYEAKVIKVAV